mmetsp:Transcript_46304/g.128845  ORF Transcript_46304/g.128845 Transcript_46304/m.128845 type:complete len:262 (-) Transcript_46304:1937-2722(-)
MDCKEVSAANSSSCARKESRRRRSICLKLSLSSPCRPRPLALPPFRPPLRFEELSLAAFGERASMEALWAAENCSRSSALRSAQCVGAHSSPHSASRHSAVTAVPRRSTTSSERLFSLAALAASGARPASSIIAAFFSEIQRSSNSVKASRPCANTLTAEAQTARPGKSNLSCVRPVSWTTDRTSSSTLASVTWPCESNIKESSRSAPWFEHCLNIVAKDEVPVEPIFTPCSDSVSFLSLASCPRGACNATASASTTQRTP